MWVHPPQGPWASLHPVVLTRGPGDSALKHPHLVGLPFLRVTLGLSTLGSALLEGQLGPMLPGSRGSWSGGAEGAQGAAGLRRPSRLESARLPQGSLTPRRMQSPVSGLGGP